MMLITQRHAPYSGQAPLESLDLALGFAVMDQPCALLFIDDGVWQLLSGQSPNDQKNLAKNFAALPLFGIEHLYCDESSLIDRGIKPSQLIEGVTLLHSQEVCDFLQTANGVFAL